jgi:hypothetical protein
VDSMENWICRVCTPDDIAQMFVGSNWAFRAGARDAGSKESREHVELLRRNGGHQDKTGYTNCAGGKKHRLLLRVRLP